MPTDISRRTTCLLLGAAVAGGPTLRSFAAPAAESAGPTRGPLPAPRRGPFDLADPQDRIAAYVKVRASLDGTPRIYHYHADYFGVPDAAAPRLLLRREGVSVHRMAIAADGSAALRYTECNYTLDERGAPVDRWLNPLTGVVVPVRNQAPSAGLLVRITPDGASNPGMNLTPPSSSSLLFSAPVVSGGRIWFTDDILLFRTSADAASFQMSTARHGDLQLTELITFESALADVQDPRLVSAPATATIGAVVPWMPWMGMKDAGGRDIPGRLMLRYRCRKLADREELPAWLATRVERDFPGFLSDPKLELQSGA